MRDERGMAMDAGRGAQPRRYSRAFGAKKVRLGAKFLPGRSNGVRLLGAMALHRLLLTPLQTFYPFRCFCITALTLSTVLKSKVKMEQV